MLGLEIVSILAIVWLSAVILKRAPLSWAPFYPDASHSLVGVGLGLIFAMLCYSGFESATTIGEETHEPFSILPGTMLIAVLIVTAIYTLGSYAQVVGFGLDQVAMLADDDAPLDTLSRRYLSGRFGTLLDGAAAISAFGCALGCATAGARLLYAPGRAGLSLRLATLEPRHGTPRHALLTVTSISAVAILLFANRFGAHAFSGAVFVMMSLATILAYGAVCLAQATISLREGRIWQGLASALGIAVLCWPLLNSVYPIPTWPANLWPLLVLIWIGLGMLPLAFLPFSWSHDDAARPPQPNSIENDM